MKGETALDPRKMSFSQAYGYEQLPQPLKLGELSDEARTKLWSVLYTHVERAPQFVDRSKIGARWSEILRSVHEDILHRPADEFETTYSEFTRYYKHIFMYYPLNQVFDVLLAIMRHNYCPPDFTHSVANTFEQYRLAYIVDVSDPPTIYPAATENEGKAILRAATELTGAGLVGAASHLRLASDCINQGDYTSGVRESIHAVESVARHIDSNAETLAPALKSLEKSGVLHPALKKAFSSLYGYTSDEQGIRHALIDNPQANVGQDEAVFMLGACASFSGYLARKHQRPTP